MPLPSEARSTRLFTLDAPSEADVLREGGALSDDFEGYFGPDAGRAAIVPAPSGRMGIGQSTGGRPAYVVPVDGLVPLDQWSLRLLVRRTGPVTERTTLVHAARSLWLWLDPDGSLVVRWKPAGLEVSAVPPEGASAEGVWQAVAVDWDGVELRASIAGGSEGAAQGRLTEDALPVSFCDGGLLVLSGSVDVPAVEVADLVIDRYAESTPPADRPGPLLRIDAAAHGTAFPPYLGGALALYTGFRLFEDGVDPDVGTSVRDQQFDRCTAAGLPLVRFGGVVSATRVAADGTLDFSLLHDKLDRLHDGGAAFHLSLDFNHPLTGLDPDDPWGSARTPPDDHQRYAQVCSEVIAHLKARYRVVSVTLWNEPDIADYWAGTQDEFLALWEAVQRRFMVDHPELLLGTADFAGAEAAANGVRFAAERGLPLSAVYCHNYDQDVHGARLRLRALRAVMVDHGFANVPLRITEWSMAIMRQQLLYTTSTSVNRVWGNRFRDAHAGAYALAFVCEAMAEDPLIDMGAFSSIGAVDAGLIPTEARFLADESMFSATDPPQPYPSFAAMSLIWKLGGRWVPAVANWPGVRAMATVDAGGVTTVVFGSWRPWRGNLDRLRLALDLDGLPDRFTWEQWAVDARHPGDSAGAELVGGGTEADVPTAVDLGAVGVGALRITPR